MARAGLLVLRLMGARLSARTLAGLVTTVHLVHKSLGIEAEGIEQMLIALWGQSED